MPWAGFDSLIAVVERSAVSFASTPGAATFSTVSCTTEYESGIGSRPSAETQRGRGEQRAEREENQSSALSAASAPLRFRRR